MKKTLLAILLAGSFAAPAIAQLSIQIGPQERTRIKEYVVKEKRNPAKFPSGFTFSIGATLPESVEVYELPDQRDHGYVVVEGRPVLVERRTRRVIQYID